MEVSALRTAAAGFRWLGPNPRRDMSRKKVSTTIYITPEQADRLKLLHERTKVPIAVYIREGIDLVLKHYEHVLPGQMTLEAAPAPAQQTPRPPAVAAARAPAHDVGLAPGKPGPPPHTPGRAGGEGGTPPA